MLEEKEALNQLLHEQKMTNKFLYEILLELKKVNKK